jgi:hypothetical protein
MVRHGETAARQAGKVSTPIPAPRSSEASVAHRASIDDREREDTTMAEQSKPQATSATTNAAQISLEEFIEIATRAALRALAERGGGGQVAALSPQPLPPEAAIRPGGRIITGIIAEPE